MALLEYTNTTVDLSDYPVTWLRVVSSRNADYVDDIKDAANVSEVKHVTEIQHTLRVVGWREDRIHCKNLSSLDDKNFDDIFI